MPTLSELKQKAQEALKEHKEKAGKDGDGSSAGGSDGPEIRKSMHAAPPLAEDAESPGDEHADGSTPTDGSAPELTLPEAIRARNWRLAKKLAEAAVEETPEALVLRKQQSGSHPLVDAACDRAPLHFVRDKVTAAGVGEEAERWQPRSYQEAQMMLQSVRRSS